MAILLVNCDFSYSCAAADKISTDLRARTVSLRQLSYLLRYANGQTDRHAGTLMAVLGTHPERAK